MKMKPGEKEILPLWFRTGLVVTLITTIVFAWTNRIEPGSNIEQEIAASAHGQLVASRQLHFVDIEGGVVSVLDANDGNELLRLQTGEDGFMRSVMRGFARERRAQGMGPDVPFELVLWEDGLVSLIDPATERRVELSAFGIDNVAAFARLLSDKVAPQSAALVTFDRHTALVSSN